MGLTHMNGRVYDPTLARFISADPNVQAPFNSQSFNRYSYLWNAPLSGTDPSGYLALVVVEGQAIAQGMGFSVLCSGGGCSELNNQSNGSTPPKVEVLDRMVKQVQSAGRGAVNLAAMARKEIAKNLSKIGPVPSLIGFTVYLMTQDASKAPSDEKKAEDGLNADGARAAAGGAAPPPDGDNNEKEKVRFGKNENQEYHAFRHVDEAGLDRQAVRDSIKQDLSRVGDSLKEGLYEGRVSVNGTQVDYNAYKFADGSINVGRITTPPKVGP